MSLKIDLPNDVIHIIESLENNGYEAFVVGGCVRDSILKRMPSDWDITTNATPQQVQEIFPTVIPTGIKHGTVTVIYNYCGYEITTYRIEGEYEDSRRPKDVKFTNSLKEDLSRRDFTINAMAYNQREGLIDYFDGLKHIEEKMIVCVGNPNERFNEDALRMLRAVRFSAQLNFKIGVYTIIGIMDNYDNIKNISKERIQSELNKMLLCDNHRIEVLNCLGVLEIIIPELSDLRFVTQRNPYHIYNGFKHSLQATKYIEDKLYLKLTMLLHDLGKYKTETTDELGVNHYIGHEIESVYIAEKVLKRLKYDNNTIKKVLTLIEFHDRSIEPTHKAVRRFLNKIGSYDLFKDWIKVKMADILAQNPIYIQSRVKSLTVIELIAEDIISKQQALKVSDLKINGNDLIDLGYKGKEIGEELNRLLDIVIDNPYLNYREYLLDESERK